jgi:hypothetical protein
MHVGTFPVARKAVVCARLPAPPIHRYKSENVRHMIKLELLQCRYPCVYFKYLQHGLHARPVSVPGCPAWWRATLTAKRHGSHNESREDQRRGEMPERLPIS